MDSLLQSVLVRVCTGWAFAEEALLDLASKARTFAEEVRLHAERGYSMSMGFRSQVPLQRHLLEWHGKGFR